MRRALQFLFTLTFLLGATIVSTAQAPVANFSGNITSSCAPFVVQFTDLSTNSPTSWNWNLGNGTTSTLQNPSTTYTTPGSYTIVLTVTNASGSDTKTITNYITASPTPTVDFVASDTTPACGTKTVSLTNLSTPNTTGAAIYSWDFGDGSTSSAVTPPAHTYTAPGVYSLSLVVTNSAGCTQSRIRNNYITVLARPTAAFTAANTTSCAAPVIVSFTNTSSGASTYQWNFGDGGSSALASPTHAYTASGTYNVRLIATSGTGCKDTTIHPTLISIGNLTPAFTQNATTCTGYAVAFTNTTTPSTSSSLWNFGDGTTSTATNPTHAYVIAGTYTIKLKSTYLGCVDSVTHTITVSAGPASQFSGSPLVACAAPLTVNFTNTTSGAVSYLWIFGDGSTSTATSPSHAYTTLGSYTVQLISTSSNGCTDTFTRAAYVNIVAPTASLTTNPLLGCAPASTTFSPTVNSLVSVASYAWTYGDGGTGFGATPTHTYTTAGTYTVSVTITTTTGCIFTASQTVVVGSHSTPSFTASPTTVCFGQAVTFSNASSGATSYSWQFGNGATSTATNPTYVYPTSGTFSVTLTSTNNGCNDIFVRTNYIVVRPATAAFTPVYDCVNKKAFTFTNTSVNATSYSWDFGDGGTSTTTSPTYTYVAYGTYTVRLIATNTITGCIDTATAQVIAFPVSVAFSASDTLICRGQPIVLNAAPVSPYYTTYTLDYGDGIPSFGYFGHTYTTTGIYTVKYIVHDIAGCSDSLVRPNYIRVHAPTVSFTQSAVTNCRQLSVVFTDNSTPSAGTSITNRFWDFGDGSTTTTTATTITHTYITGGSFTVKLAITESGSGCTDTLTKLNLITVNRPVAQFTSTGTLSCKNGITSFTNTSTGNALTYSWDFGDGGTSTAVSPTHTYAAVGNYSVRLIVMDATGCTDTLTRTNYINVSTVKSGFGMSDSLAACPPFTVSFYDSSVGASSYLWIFGNGSTSTLANPSAAFITPGTFNVLFVAINASGCRDTSTHTIVVGTGPVGTFSFSPLSGCTPLTVSFTATSNTSSLTFDFDNGATTTTTSNSITFTYTQAGIFHPRLILSNGASCTAFIASQDSVRVFKAKAGFSALPTPACISAPVQFTDTSSAVATTIASRAWDFGDGGSSTATNPTHSYTATGTYSVRLIISTPAGCVDTAYRTVVVNPLPVVTAIPQTICGNSTVQLNATGAATYTWTPAATLSCSACANPVASPTVTTTYTITGTSAAGCINTGTVTVSVNPVPTVGVSAAQAICSGASATLTATGAATYAWSPATGLSATTGASVTASPAATTTYTVTGTTVAGCTATNTVTVTVNPVPTVSVTPSQSVCTGTPATLTASGATTYSWSPATGLSSTTAASVTATPVTTTTYTVTGTAGGCSATANTTVTVVPTPVLSAGAAVAICAGASATLTVSGATTYSWSPATGLSATTGASVTASPAATTTYTIIGTTAGCAGTTTKTVTVNPLPTVTASPNVTICAGISTTLTASGATTYSWSPATGLSSATTASTTALPTATTNYVVTGTDANGCVDTGMVTVTVNPLPIVSGGSNQFICPGGSVTLNASGAVTYSWSPASGLSATTGATVTATPSATTTYTVTGFSAANCSATATVTVTINSTPAVTVTGTGIICAGGSTTLTASGATAYSWSPATGLSATTGATVTANPAVTTTYTITGTSGVGCSATTTKTVTVNPLPTVSAGGPTTAICAGASATLTATGATSYVWSPATGLSGTTTASVTATPGATTTYTVTGTNANGCVNTDTIRVLVNLLPTVSAGSNTSVCPGSSATLTATGGVSYVWSPATGLSSTTTASTTATPSATTTYTVTGTGSNGCTNTSAVTVAVNQTPTVTVTGTAAICTGGSTILTASGANSFSWSPATGLSATTGATVTATPAATTTYTVTGTSGVGCSGTATFTVTVNPLPTVSAGANVAICTGTSTTLTATGATSYVWSPATGLSGTTTASVTASPSATTTYTVTGTNSNGCVNTASVVVTVNPLPTVSAGSNVSICPGSSTTLTASGASTYSWSPTTGLSPTTGAIVTAAPSATTTYTVTGTSAAGCSTTASVTVSVNLTPVVTITGTAAICTGGGTTLTASGANSFSWSPATGLSATTGATVTANPTATTTYTITGTSGVGCSATTTFTVTVNPLPTVSAGANVAICAGTSTTLTASGASTYAWSPATGLSATTGGSVTASPAATTTYTVTGTNSTGCTNTASVTVTVNSLPTVSAGSNVAICPGLSTTLGASGAATYSWSPATGLSCTACASPVASPSATTIYTVTGTNAAGCSNTAAVTVSVNPTPTVAIAGTTSICAGGSTTLTASGANSYSWSPVTGLSSATGTTVTANPAATTTYTVTGTSGVGCSGTATVTITVNPLPVVSAGPAVSICAGSSTILGASGGVSYVWTPAASLSSATSATPTATPSATTTYTVTGASAAGCTASSTVTVTVNPLPTVSAGSNTQVCPGGSVTLTATGAQTYVWTPSTGLSTTTSASTIATPAATTTYTVTGTATNGCNNTSTVTVTVNPIPVVAVSGNTSVCAGATTTLTASGAATYAWSPATGLSSTTGNPVVVTPAATTTYTITGTSGVGCTGTATITVVVHPLPVVNANASQTTCLKTAVTLTASGASTYAWSPSAGLSSASGASVTATPSITTTYTVTGTDGFGCTDTAQTTVTILPLPPVSAGPDVSSCKLNSVVLNATGAASYVWSPAAGLSCTTCASPTATPAVTTTYVVTGTGANGCIATDTVNVTLYAQPPVNAGPDQTICAGRSAQLQASGATSYLWTPAFDLSCAACANPVATPASTITYLVSGTDVNGCRDSDMVTISVIRKNPVTIDTGGDFCVGGSIQLHASGGDSYAWSPATGLSCTDCPNPLASPVASTTYTVIIKQGQCFADTLRTNVVIHPLPTVSAGPDQSIILGSTAQITATGTDISRYSWTPGSDLSCTDCASPVASPPVNTTYTVIVVSEFGCTASDSVRISVRCDGTQVWMPNTFTPNADGQNDFFYPHGKGISSIPRFRIYDRWGELVFERTNMQVNDRNTGWDGTYKNQVLKPDVFVWILNATCTNGEPLELKGDISLVR